MKTAFMPDLIVFCAYFIYNGINHLRNRRSMSQYAESKNVPLATSARIGSDVLLDRRRNQHPAWQKAKSWRPCDYGIPRERLAHNARFLAHRGLGSAHGDVMNFSKNIALLSGTLTLMSVEEPLPASIAVARPSLVERPGAKLATFRRLTSE